MSIKDKLLESVEKEKLIECLDLRDGNDEPINDQSLVDFVHQIYNQAIDNCKRAITEFFEDESE